MTRLQIRDLIRKNLGETTSSFWSDVELNTWIDDACDDLAYRTKCLRDDGTMTPVLNTAEYTLSTYFPYLLSILEVYFKQDGTNWVKLMATNRERLNNERPGWMDADSGTPTEYYWNREENLFGLYVPPDADNDAANSIKIYYTKEHIPITTDSSEPDIPIYLQYAIVDFVCARGFDTRGNGDRANDKWQKYYSKIHDYQVERQREVEDENLIMRNYMRNYR